jgi:hypothetical protein
MGFIPVLQYFAGLGVFGFLWWLLDGILDIFIAVNMHQSGDAYDLLTALWSGIIILYLIFGGIWLVRKYNEDQYQVAGGP